MWRHPWLPIQDLPEHLATLRVVHEVHSGGPANSTYAVSLGQTQYLLFYVVGDLLAYVFSIRAAGLLLLTAYMVGTVAAMRALLVSLGRDPRLALLVVPLLTNTQFLIGFIQFLLAVPLMLWGWSLAIEYGRARRRRDGLLLAVVAILTFYSHVVPFGVLLIGLAILAPWSSGRALGRFALPLVPAALLVAWWVLVTNAGRAVREALRSGADARDPWPFDMSLHNFYPISLDTYNDSADEKLFALTCVVALGMTALARSSGSRAERSTGRWLLIPLACAVLYFRSDGSVGYLAHIRDRFSLLAFISLIPAARMPRGAWGIAGTGALVVASVMTAQTWNWHLARFNFRDVGDFDGALAHIPPNKHVAGLIFTSETKDFTDYPFLHFPAYYAVDRGGVVEFSFAGYPHWVDSFRPHRDPLGASPPPFLWEWEPGRVEVREELAAAYDYILTRGPGFDPPDGWFIKTWEGARWAVWQRRAR